MPATILYSLVSRDVNVLAEFTESGIGGNFFTLTRALLKKIPSTLDGRNSYIHDEYVFHTVVSGGLTYLCMCDKEFQRVIAYKFLDAVEKEFLKLFESRWINASAYAFNPDFKGILDELMREYSSLKDEKIARIQDQIVEVREVMQTNIEKVLERGEKIEILVDKSQQMESHAFKFHKKATKLKRKMCCKNYKWCILLAIIVLVVIYVILVFSCGGPALAKCTKK